MRMEKIPGGIHLDIMSFTMLGTSPSKSQNKAFKMNFPSATPESMKIPTASGAAGRWVKFQQTSRSPRFIFRGIIFIKSRGLKWN